MSKDGVAFLTQKTLVLAAGLLSVLLYVLFALIGLCHHSTAIKFSLPAAVLLIAGALLPSGGKKSIPFLTHKTLVLAAGLVSVLLYVYSWHYYWYWYVAIIWALPVAVLVITGALLPSGGKRVVPEPADGERIWNWNAAFFGFWWYYYHKMWLKGAIIMLAAVAVGVPLTLALPSIGWLLALIAESVYCGRFGDKDLRVFGSEGREDFSEINARLRGKSKECPFCAETIKEQAKVCRYCGRDLPPP